jgi:hypothetical protein
MYTRVHTQTHTYIYIYSDACIEPPLRAAAPTPKAPRKPVPSRVQARARTSAVPPRTTGRIAPKPRPSVPAHSARRRAEKAAHTPYNTVTRAVFHAPMSALNRFAE